MSVTVSPKFQIVIPKKIRDEYNIKPGQKWEFVPISDGLTLVPVLDLQGVQKLFKGKNLRNDFSREDEWTDEHRS